MVNMAETNCTEREDIEITSEEALRLKEAFHDKNFIKLFQDYVEDINSKESRQKYEEEIKLLERDRGYDVKFIHPVPFYVLKFILNADKIFVNICQNQYAREPVHEKKNGGTQWSIPVILSKPRNDVDKKGSKCKVYDVMFHPETIELAKKNQRLKNIVEETATSMISENFGVSLDLKTVKYPKLKYKGNPPHVVLRQKSGTKETCVACETVEEYWKSHLPKSPVIPLTPKYEVKYRDIVDMKDYSLRGYTDKCAPKEIIIEISLPGVKEASDVVLDVFERKLSLKSCNDKKHCYNLDLDLSYAVKCNDGRAKFDKANNKLVVQLPLKDRGIPCVLGKYVV